MTNKTREAEPAKLWWLKRPKYIAIFLREASSFFILLYVLIYLQLLSEFQRDITAYSAFLASLRSPFFIGLNLLILAFTLYHAITWFLLLPRFQPIQVAGFKIEGPAALVLNLALLLLASAAVTGLILDPELLRFGVGV